MLFRAIRKHTMINESLNGFFNGFLYDAHPMAMLTGVVGSLSAFYNDTSNHKDPRHQEIFAHRMIAKIPTIAAAAYKRYFGQPFMYPQNHLDYRSEEHTSELQSLMRISYAVFCLKKQNIIKKH